MRSLVFCFLATMFFASNASAEAVEIGQVAQGPIFYNRPGATVAEHNSDLSACFQTAPAPASASRPKMLVYDVNTHVTYDATWVFDMVWSGPLAGLRAVRVENCMLLRGWRAVRLPDAEGARLAALAPAELISRMQPLIGVEQPPGEIVRSFANEALHPGAYKTASRPAQPSKTQLSLKLYATYQAASPMAIESAPTAVLDPAWPTAPLKLKDLGEKPSEAGLIVVRVTGISNKFGTGVTFSREGPSPDQPASIADRRPDIMRATIGFMSAKKEGNWFVLAVPPGRWRIASSGFVDYCLGSPSFEVKAGDGVYAGTFHLEGPDLSPDLDLAPAQAFMASVLTARLHAAEYRNGSRQACSGSMVTYGLEFPERPFAPDYKWGSLAKKQ